LFQYKIDKPINDEEEEEDEDDEDGFRGRGKREEEEDDPVASKSFSRFLFLHFTFVIKEFEAILKRILSFILHFFPFCRSLKH
jgi:hypothetical protein